MPLAVWAKLLMAAQSVLSLVIIALVVARAVNRAKSVRKGASFSKRRGRHDRPNGCRTAYAVRPYGHPKLGRRADSGGLDVMLNAAGVEISAQVCSVTISGSIPPIELK